jgi:hypothetical protein
MTEQVTEYIQNVKVDWQTEICAQLREAIHQAVPDVTERLQYGKPHFLKNGKYLAVLGTAKEWVSFTIFNADTIEADFFEEGGTDRKTVKIRKGQSAEVDRLAAFLQKAAETIS